MAGAITSDAGALLVRQVGGAICLFRRLGACFLDRAIRTAWCTACAMTRCWRLLSESLTPRRQDCAALAGKSMLNRLEHGRVGGPPRYHKIGHD